MKVLFLTNIPTPYRVDFFNELGKDCELTVLFERKRASDRDEQWIADKFDNFQGIFLNGKNTRADAAICLDVIKWLDNKRFDIFVIGGYSTPTGMLAIQTLKIKKIPFILNCDGGFIKNDRRIVHQIKKYFISSAKWWLSTGNLTSKYLEHYGAKRKNIYKYPFTSIKEIDIMDKKISNDEKNKLKNKLGIKSKKVALSVGSFIERKGYDLLINEWKKIQNEWELIIIGSGQDKEKLEQLISKYNLENVKLLDFKQKSELKEYYYSADLFILLTREDIWGLVINEAMAYGLPVITTNKCIAGMEMIKNEENGFIVNLENELNINKYINKINEDMGVQSLKISKKYSIEDMSKAHIKIFKSILKQEN